MIRYRGSGRATVYLEGEIDRTTVPAVRAALAACVANGVTEIDVELAAVGFCDASGLNVFLEVSQHLAASEGELRLHHPAPVVSRLLDLTGTGFLLAEESSGVEQPPAETTQPSSGAA
ncbi:anti-anti-sigma factor [Streptomyces sp. Ag109_O5-1]|uniref:STAS domain-containing protein n=1 Tax=Streptomyces sp. Ag109_O5-1 TaxID=1938851 RepID=UPI000F4EE0DF|nr:STAS domain-containing protein [Streptomyces sp. Ag109_O5-1]RPE39909.1 anti-anti-sigma factor [Streptomyces sp. Ag109_O5-1]